MLINETEVVTLVLSERIIDNPNISYYQISYVVCIAGLIVATFLNALTYVMFCLRASTKLHDQIFRKLVASPMNFFDITPSGQILNRFSKDTDESQWYVQLSFICSWFALSVQTVQFILYKLFQWTRPCHSLLTCSSNVSVSLSELWLSYQLSPPTSCWS